MTNDTIIHPSSVIEDGAKLGSGVRIGPFCHVAGEAVIGDAVELIGQVSVLGATALGKGCVLHPHASVGGAPQSVNHKGGPTSLTIGGNCVIRECATIHRGTDTGRGATTVGDNCFIMAYSHVGHDCDVGNNVTMANFTSLGGHSVIGDFVNMGGYAAVHQHVRVGHHAFLAGYAAVTGDVIPYGMAIGDRAKLRGLNVVGLKRSGMTRSDLLTLRRAYNMLFSRERPFSENIELVSEQFRGSEAIQDIVRFLAGRKRRQLTVPALGRGMEDDVDEAE